MPESETVIAHGNDVFHVEVRGFDHIPDSERNMTLPQVDYLWVGTSVNLLSFTLGVLAIGTGLNLWLALGACLVGTLLYALVAIGSIATVRAGLPVNTLSRAAFGLRGNLGNAFLSWVASVIFEVINTVFGVEAVLALFRLLGWSAPGGAGKLLAVMLQLLLCGGIAVLGHATMVWFQRFFAVAVGAAFLAVMGCTLPKVDWAHAATAHATLSTGTALAAFLTATAVIASNPISFLFNGPDWVRYLPANTPWRGICRHVFRASFMPSILLTMMGAYCATLGDMSDPVAGLKPYIPGPLFAVYIISVIGGSLANSVPTYYSSGLTLQALGLRVHRWTATLLDVVVSTLITLYVIFVQDFTTALNDFIALMMMWVGPFGGVWIADAWFRRGRYDGAAIHRSGHTSRYWGWRGFNLAGCGALALGMLACALTMRSPLYDGPLARWLGGADLSWLLGFPVSALTYLLLAKLPVSRPSRLPSAGVPQPD
ncbi:MAG TPA: cytosine permease [Steroidobacteraceae bacterium]|nr:cytosine permease [Steroidobacteraceae bacterium]